MNVILAAVILAIALIIGAFLVGGRYVVVISDTAINSEIPYKQGLFIVDRYNGTVTGCTVAACRGIVRF
jgi:hypothetical protein